MKQSVPVAIKYLISVFITGILFFTAFRLILTFSNATALHNIPGVTNVMLHSLFMGLRFDIVISGYILALPAVVLIFAEFGCLLSRWLLLFTSIFIGILYILSFFICTADIPFFNNYNSRLNITILNWTSSPGFMVKMVWQDKVLLGYFIFFIVISILFAVLLSKIFRKYVLLISPFKENKFRWKPLRFILSLLFFCFMFLGIRGRTDEKAPITVGTAYFCSYDFPNQAGLNPVYTFMQSWMDGMKDANKKLELTNDESAIKYVQDYFHIPVNLRNRDFPLLRKIETGKPEQKYNVVVIIMESMSACYLQRYGNNKHLTPNLDSLTALGYSFDNFYSAGIHTFNGIFSTLYAYPALLARHTMDRVPIPAYTGLPGFLNGRGYQTVFFMTHDDQFDNIGGFLTRNHINKIISKKDYPPDQVKSTLGVPDHCMFNYSMPILHNFRAQNKPFLAIYMTTSNHDPYIVPNDIPFVPQHLDVRGGCVEYADWAIGNFMRQAEMQPWFNNTIFVFTGDHGVGDGGANYGDLPLSYSHVPCIIFMPGITKQPKQYIQPGGQIDLFPTIAGLLGGNYTNNTMGIDLLNEQRKYMFFSQDDKVGVADTTDLYVWHTRGTENIFNIYNIKEQIPINRNKADSMKNYAFSMIQCAQWMLKNKATGGK